MNLHLRQLLRSNDMPSDAAIKEVNELIAKPTQELTETEEDIRRLEQAVEALKEKRRAVQKAMSTYIIILSPARRLPADILREIFFHCLPTTRNCLMSYSEAPLLLTRVSSQWRSIALTSPRIWSRLHIPLPGSLKMCLDSLGPGMLTESQYTDKMEKRQQGLKVWLSRSGSCPLSLSLYYPGFHIGHDGWDSHTENLVNATIPYAGRWRELQLVLPLDVYEQFQAKFTVDMVPLLHTLRVSISNRSGVVSRSFPILEAPGIKALSFNVMGSPWSSYPTSFWHRLTDLSFHSHLPEEEFFALLKACNNLVTCRITVAPGGDRTGPLWKETIFLPYLETLSINGSCFGIMAAEFPDIITPVLRSLDLTLSVLHPIPEPGQGAVGPPLTSPIPMFVENAASTIRQLIFQPSAMRKQHMQQCLKLPICLQHLVLGVKLSLPDWLRQLQQSRFSLHWAHEGFSIEWLVVKDTADEIEGEEEILLPYLEVFESYSIPTEISDKSLARFICSRLHRIRPATGTATSSSLSSTNPSSPNLPPLINGIAVLRKVCVEFLRPREIDIKEEVQEAAKAAGVDFVLELTYPPVQPRQPDPLSVAYGTVTVGQSFNFLTGHGHLD